MFVFPASAGVIRVWPNIKPLNRRVPRECGGDPEDDEEDG